MYNIFEVLLFSAVMFVLCFISSHVVQFLILYSNFLKTSSHDYFPSISPSSLLFSLPTSSNLFLLSFISHITSLSKFEAQPADSA